MKHNTKNIFFIEMNLSCTDRDNKETRKKIELGLIRTANEVDPKSFLTMYCESKEFHNLIWDQLNKFYEPKTIRITFLKPKILNSSIIIPSKRIFHTVHYKM